MEPMEPKDRTTPQLKVAGERGETGSDDVFRRLVESVKDYAIFMLDPNGIVTTWNAGAERFKGYTATEIVGRHFSAFYTEADIAAGKCEHELTIAAESGTFEEEGWRLRKDGTRFWANVVISAMRGPRGELIGFSKVTRDLTERRKAEEATTARIAAEHANRAKDELLAMLGHELRNPLAPILSALQLLELRGAAREHQVIERHVRQMTRIVDDLLDVSRILQGMIELEKERIDLRDVLARAVELSTPLLERKRHRFEVRGPSYPVVVSGDQARLTQIFSNLLGNAAKYTSDGGQIGLSVHHTKREIVVEVRDNGVGIDPNLLPHVFDLFVQGHQGPDRAAGGLGLGLTMVRSLVELHGGAVEVRSASVGTGSVFTVRLPWGEAAREDAAPSTRVTDARKILLVDDNEDARTLLEDLLATFGHEVRSAGDGEAALALLGEFRPDVAILDIGLPGMDGHELARRIRAISTHEGIRVLALTGYGQASDVAQAKAAGFDVHLVKPVDVRRLLEHLAAK